MKALRRWWLRAQLSMVEDRLRELRRESCVYWWCSDPDLSDRICKARNRRMFLLAELAAL